MSDDEVAALTSQHAKGAVERTKKVLDLRTFRKVPTRDAFHARLLALTVEALRRDVIDSKQFEHLTGLVGLIASERLALLDIVASG